MGHIQVFASVVPHGPLYFIIFNERRLRGEKNLDTKHEQV
jgi:hypothetical protein